MAVTLQNLETLNDRLWQTMDQLKALIYQPNAGKVAPSFSTAQLCLLCNKKRTQMDRLLQKAEAENLPTGLSLPDGATPPKHRTFSLDEATKWIRAVGTARYIRKPGQKGAVVTVGFFKGGVGKTILATSLAQGLSLKGYKVLVIDFDPQGSMTAMFGIEPSSVAIEETFTPLATMKDHPAHNDNLAESIRPTYWSGIDIIAGSTGLFACEFYLPLRSMNARSESKQFNFLEVLDKALDMGLRDEYDYIVIDTPPALSYTTMNAYWAANAILMPVVPEGLSLQSSVQFWDQFAEMASVASQSAEKPKEYSWVGVVPSKVEGHKKSMMEMMQWIRLFYGDYVLTSEIPLTDAVKTGGAKFNTLYDIAKPSQYDGGAATYLRARDAYDRVVNEVDVMTRKEFWNEISES